MTDGVRPQPITGGRTPPVRPRPKRPGPLPTYALTMAAFLVVLTLLAWQVRAGRDPAIGAAKPPPAAPAKKRILVKRIERRVIVTVPAAPAPAAVVPAGGTAPAAAAPVAAAAPLAAAAPAPATAAPAPAAPAPAPAPVVATRSS